MSGAGKPPLGNQPPKWSTIDESWAEGPTDPQSTLQVRAEGVVRPSPRPAQSPNLGDPQCQPAAVEPEAARLPTTAELGPPELGDEWEGGQETVVRFSEGQQRELPVVPPGERRLARTIMGVGSPEVKALFESRLAGAGAAADPPAGATSKPAPPRVKPVVLEKPQPAPLPPRMPEPASPEPPRARTTPAKATPAVPLEEAAPLARGTRPSSEELFGSTAPMKQPPVEVLSEEPPGSSDGSTVPSRLLVTGPPLLPAPPVSIEPRNQRARPPSPARATPAMPRGPVAHPGGPANWVLILLWCLAAVSVGLAIYLYAR